MPDASDIVDIIAGEPGPKSDITLFRENRDNFDPKQKFKGDLGYNPHSAPPSVTPQENRYI